MGSIEPRPEQLRAFAAGEGPAPLVMLNLLRYRERAAYPRGSDHAPCSGREAYERRYGPAAMAHVAKAGGRVLFGGAVAACVIAPEGEFWDDAVLVEYPSRDAFLAMVSDPEYRAIAVHRSAALEDSRLIALGTAASAL